MSSNAQDQDNSNKKSDQVDPAFVNFTKSFKSALDQLRMSQEPTQELQHIVQVVSEAAKTNRMGSDENFAKFIYEHSLSLLNKCAKEITKDPVYLEAVANTLEAFIDLFIVELKHKRYNQLFACAMTWAFQPDCNLHNRHFLMSEDELRRIITTPQVWRKDLKAGMQVDVQIYADEKKKMMGWLQGTITADNGDILSIEFPEADPAYNMQIDRWDINLAPFGEKTAENYQWRKENLTGAVDYVCDMHDMDQWWEGTIFKTEFREVQPNQRIEVAYCAFRVYRNWGDKMKKDERGEFDGWSKKYDEWIPIYSPRIMPHLSKKGVSKADNIEIDEDLDNMVEPEEGYDRIIGVPRMTTCISSKFIHFMNKFGNEGGFESILDIIENAEPDENLSMTTIGYLITMLSMPIKLFHKDFIEEYAQRFSDGMKKKMLTCSDAHFKSISMGDVDQIQTSINQLNSRIVTRDEMKVKEQILKLEIVKRCLSSEYLERRILGIKTLNQIIRQNTLQQQKVLPTEKLIEWMDQKEVFAIIWDNKRTHLQLVQRSNEIFKMLLREDLLSMPLLEKFWSLTKSDYKSEVLKIMNESAYYLKQPQVEYLFREITQTPANKLGMEEFNALSDLGKYNKDGNFQTKVSDFFWKIITDSGKYKDELLENCISKFSEMIRYWSIEKKEPFFNQLSEQLKKTENSAIPVLKLFTKLIKDQKARVIYNGSSATSGSKPTNVTEYSKTVSATGNVIYSRSFNNNGNSTTQPQESIYNKIEDGEVGTVSTTENGDGQEGSTKEVDKELTLEDLLNRAWQQQDFVENLLENLRNFIEATRVKTEQDPSLLNIDRSELKLIYGKYSHAEEVKERLNFLQEFAANCAFKVSQAQLQVIYDLLSKSPLPSDMFEFYTWCQQACEDKVAETLEMLQVGQFVSNLIDEKKLNVADLPVVGFKFIQSYWTSVNVDAHKIMMVEQDKKQKEDDNSWTGGWYNMGSSSKKEEVVVDDLGESPNFMVGENPTQLLELGLIWQIVLQSRQKEVTTRAINLLVNSHVSLQQNLQDNRSKILQELNSECFRLLALHKEDEFLVKRLVLVLQTIIQFSEFQGTGGVQPHNALFKGEMLNRVIVKYMVKNKQSFYGGLKLDKSVVVKLYTSATVWEFKQEVSRMLGLAPKYVKFELPNKTELRENQHGMVLQQLNLKNGDIITAQKISVKEQIPEAPIWDRQNNCLTPAALKLFSEWFNTYKNPETGLMGKGNLASFIRAATKQNCTEGDSRVEKIMGLFDSDKDDQLTEADFIHFYSDASKGDEDQRGAVRANLKNLNVRPDLKKISEVIEESQFKKTDMPRYTLSANQDQFHALIDLLDRKDSASGDVWNLVRALATNQHMYNEVLGLENVTNDQGQVDWKQVFEDPSVYKQIYKQEIIVAVMESSKSESEKRVMFVEEQIIADKFVNNQNQEGEQGGKTQQNDALNQEMDEQALEIEKMKLVWTKQFLENGGFQYILKSFLSKGDNKDVASGNSMNLQAQVKDISFLSTLSRVFFTAAFGTLEGNNIMQMVRRSSSLADEGSTATSATSVKEEKELEKLSNLIKGAPSAEILYNTDFELVVKKMLDLIANVLLKKEFILEDKLIVENCLSILLGSILYQTELFKHLTHFKGQGSIKNAQDLILQGLLKCPEEKIRQDFKMTLGVMTQNLLKTEQNCLNYILGLLGDSFAQSTTNPCRQYFELFNELIDYVTLREALGGDSKSGDLSIYDPEKLLAQIIDEIKNNKKKSAEQALNEEEGSDEVKVAEMAAENDRLMVGLINLTGKIIKNAKKEVSDRIIEEKDLISQIFREFLFASYYKAVESGETTGQQSVLKQNNRNKSSKKQVVTNNKSREAAYDLLNQLIQNSGYLMSKFINQQLVPLIKEVKKPKGWTYMPQTNLETSQKYVGLRNLGCICYMNSMMQQFFMIPAFRYNLLCVDDGKSEELVEYKGENIDDNMLHQMQRLIAHLELSTRNEYNPLSFCFAFKEFDGTPTNTSEQKDASEFLTILFDRLENALKPTPRKYLCQSIFGGKYCQQMVCSECGKVKNRLEDFYFLSLDVKDLKSVNESLSKQIEGEIISDYQCDGCNRKVDLSKRTLIAETPNILIVHLKRLVFNFDTFQNDKLNSFMKFPTVLDLKPYSYFDVMEKEGRKKTTEEDGQEEESSNKPKIEEMTEEELLKKQEAENDAREPIQDDCFEYKLVGVNVHSGTANAGHYWSYINTHRGTSPEEEAQQAWLQTEKDPWMEYNDSSVTDWQFKDMESKCFGNEQKTNSYGSYYSMGDSYGTSGYMLFYERRVKKPIKIVVPDSEIEEAKSSGVEIKHDAEKNEYFREVQYRKAADGEKPNKIYQKVYEDNQKYSFENDIYSQEFFDFILQVLTNLAALKDADAIKTKLQGLIIGKKVGFAILARCSGIPGINKIAEVMVDIVKSSPECAKLFLEEIINEGSGLDEDILSVLFESPDSNTQTHLGRVIKFMLCSLKETEKELILSEEIETVKTTNNEGVSSENIRYKSVALRFFTAMIALLPSSARHWRRFDAFLDLFYGFAIHSADEIAIEIETQKAAPLDKTSEAYKIGSELFFQKRMIMILGDFILGKQSPIYKPEQDRYEMGGSYVQPNFTQLLKLITILMADEQMIAKYPLSPDETAIVSHKEILQKMIDPPEGSDTDFTDLLLGMCKNNRKLSKKMAKAYLKGISKSQTDISGKNLQAVKRFLQIEDDLKQIRIEWIFGQPQLVHKANYRTRQQNYGIDLVEGLESEYYIYKSECAKQGIEPFLQQIYKLKGRMETLCVQSVLVLIEMCLLDDDICSYIIRMAPPTIQYARYTDWFFPYAEQLNRALEAQANNAQQPSYIKLRREAVEGILRLREVFEGKMAKFAGSQNSSERIKDGEFVGHEEDCIYADEGSVIDHYPPTYLVGTCTGNQRQLLVQENDACQITLNEIEIHHMYSNPTGQFNLSTPSKLWRNPSNYTQISYKALKTAQIKSQRAANGEKTDEPIDMSMREFQTDARPAYCLLAVEIKSKTKGMMRVSIQLAVKDNANKNVNFPCTSLTETLFSSDQKIAHVFCKIDPSKDNWGDLQLIINETPSTVNQTITTTGTYGGTYGSSTYNMGGNIYSGMNHISTQNTRGVETSTSTSHYKPIGADADDAKVSCANCEAECFVGEDFCGQCGQSPLGDSAY